MDSDKTIQRKSFLTYAIILIATGVALGAIGAHALENLVEKGQLTLDNIDSWKTGVLYQLLMAGGLILMILLEKVFSISSIKTPLWILTIGVSLFSFSIYILVLNHMWEITAIKYAMVALTPIGGILMIFAWLSFLLKVRKG